MSDTSLLASVAAAALDAAAAATPETPPAAPATTTIAAPETPAAAAPPAPSTEPAPAAPPAKASTDTLTARAALEMTALAYPAMSGVFAKLATAADGGEVAFRAALLAERTDTTATPLSTASTSTKVEQPKGVSGEDRQRGASLKAAAQAQNASAPKG